MIPTPDNDTLGLALAIPQGAPPSFWPPSNIIGARLLCRLLHLALERAGLQPVEVVGGVELNAARLLLSVPQWRTALSVLRQELDQLVLTPFAGLARWDLEEGIWRWLHTGPANLPDPNTLFTATVMDVMAATFARTLRHVRDSIPSTSATAPDGSEKL